MSNNLQSGFRRDLASKKRLKWEALVIILLLIPVGIGFLLLTPHTTESSASVPHVATDLGTQVLQVEAAQGQSGAPIRQVPSQYSKVLGKVDDRYTLMENPSTGELLLNDSLGGIGTNNTSVEGDRAQLARDMVELENYANQNREKIGSAAYYWLKRVARSGIELAFGTPGLPPELQPQIKQQLLAEFHAVSTNPDGSFKDNDNYIGIEHMFKQSEAAYLAANTPAGSRSSLGLSGPSVIGVAATGSMTATSGTTRGSDFLGPDPLSPILTAPEQALISPTLTDKLRQLSTTPSPTQLVSSSSSYNFIEWLLNAFWKAVTGSTSSGSTQTAYSSGTSSSSSSTSGSTTVTQTSTSSTSTSNATVADYYNTVFGEGTAKPADTVDTTVSTAVNTTSTATSNTLTNVTAPTTSGLSTTTTGTSSTMNLIRGQWVPNDSGTTTINTTSSSSSPYIKTTTAKGAKSTIYVP